MMLEKIDDFLTLLPAGKTLLMEHDTSWGKAVFRSSHIPVG